MKLDPSSLRSSGMRNQKECSLIVEDRKSGFSVLCCSAEVHKTGEQAGSMKWELLAELCEGQGRQRGGAGGSLPV